MTFRNSRRASGFTMVELLAVIGIIVVLIGIAVVAFRGVDPSARTTRATLQNLSSMLAEFQSGGGDIASLTPPPRPLVAGGTDDALRRASVGEGQQQRVDAIEDTRKVMLKLLRVPLVKEAMAKFPAQAVFAAKDPNVPAGNPDTRPATPVPLDAWGNPMIFVPASGLANVNLSGDGRQTIRSPDGRAFWASAGPDGFFTDPDSSHTNPSQAGYKAYGDDNAYSFEH